MKATKCPTIGTFSKNSKRKGVFDLCNPLNFPYSYVVISPAKSSYLKTVKAYYILNCWTGKEKVLHTGLIEFESNWFFGDNLNCNNSKDFLLLQYLPKEKKLLLYLFEKCNPKNKIRYGRQYIKNCPFA